MRFQQNRSIPSGRAHHHQHHHHRQQQKERQPAAESYTRVFVAFANRNQLNFHFFLWQINIRCTISLELQILSYAHNPPVFVLIYYHQEGWRQRKSVDMKCQLIICHQYLESARSGGIWEEEEIEFTNGIYSNNIPHPSTPLPYNLPLV